MAVRLDLRPKYIQQYEWALTVPPLPVLERYAHIKHSALSPTRRLSVLLDDSLELKMRHPAPYPSFDLSCKRFLSTFGIDDLGVLQLDHDRASALLETKLKSIIGELARRKSRQVGDKIMRSISRYLQTVLMICAIGGDRIMYQNVNATIEGLSAKSGTGAAFILLSQLASDLKEVSRKQRHDRLGF